MNKGDLVQYPKGVAIWNTNDSPSTVIGRTTENIYIILEDGNDEIKVLCPDGLVGWVSKCFMRLNHGAR